MFNLKSNFLFLFLFSVLFFPHYVTAAPVSFYVITPPGQTANAYCNSLANSYKAGLTCALMACAPYSNVHYGFCRVTSNGNWTNSLCPSSSTRDNFYCVLPPDTPCPEGEAPDPTSHICAPAVDCTEQAGQDAGIIENSPTPPGYELLCSGSCAVEVSEFFQRTDNDNWVIAYRYTGQPCGSGDPLGEPDVPPGEEGPPSVQPNTPPDTDNDGIPDSNDSDIDGDGLPNSEDDDTDGDGNPDEDDPSPGGPGEQEPSSAAHVGLNCDQSPSCSGDAIQCAQLVELWRLRCKGGGDTEQVDESLIGEIIGNVSTAGTDALDDIEQSISDSADDPSGIEMPSTFSNFFTALFPNPICHDISFSYKSRDFTISCSKTADLRLLIAYIMFFSTCIYLYHLARKPVGE